MFWGLSEAMDLYQEYLDAYRVKFRNEEEEDAEFERQGMKNIREPTTLEMGEAPPDPTDKNIPKIPKDRDLNMLIFCPNDPRHIIKTLAKRYKHRNPETNELPTYNLFLIEKNIETVARDLLLLGIALEHPSTGIGVRRKAHIFMDIYGNSCLRPSSEQYLIVKSKSLSKIITDEEERDRLTPFFNFDYTKYKELDGIQCCFDFWGSPFKYMINNLWNNRLRNSLGSRYDHREGVFDWDYNMQLKERGASQICSQEYTHWRETGIAFNFPEYEQCKPNKTLALGVVQTGRQYHYWSFQGDIETGPFCTFGLATNDHRMTKSMHGQNDYRATDITERNLLELFYELENDKPYEHDLTWSHRYGSIRMLLNPAHDADEEAGKGDNLVVACGPWINLNGIKLYVMCAHEIYAFANKITRWEHLFDVIFAGKEYCDLIKNNLAILLRGDGLLMVETKCFTCERKEKVTEYESELMKYCTEAKLTPVINYKVMNKSHPILKYTKRSDPPPKKWVFMSFDVPLTDEEKRDVFRSKYTAGGLDNRSIDELIKTNMTVNETFRSTRPTTIPRHNPSVRPSEGDTRTMTQWPILDPPVSVVCSPEKAWSRIEQFIQPQHLKGREELGANWNRIEQQDIEDEKRRTKDWAALSDDEHGDQIKDYGHHRHGDNRGNKNGIEGLNEKNCKNYPNELQTDDTECEVP